MSPRPVSDGWLRTEAPLSPDALDDAVQRIAAAVGSLDSNGPTSDAYRAFVFPYDDARWGAIASDQLSSCALVGLAVLDCLGCVSRETDAPYHPRMGQAVSALVRLGLAENAVRAAQGLSPAWMDATVAGCPAPEGPHIALVGNNANEGLEHVYVALSGVGIGGGETCGVIEGGQPSARGRGFRIARARYRLDQRAPNAIWASRPATASRARRLRGYLELSRVDYADPAVLPVTPGA